MELSCSQLPIILLGSQIEQSIDNEEQTRNWDLRARVHQQHPPVHRAGWMICGQETFFHYVPVPQLTIVVSTIQKPSTCIHLPEAQNVILFLCSYHVPSMFSHVSNYVRQVLHLFPRVFPLAPHFYPTSSHRNLYFEELPKFVFGGAGGGAGCCVMGQSKWLTAPLKKRGLEGTPSY